MRLVNSECEEGLWFSRGLNLFEMLCARNIYEDTVISKVFPTFSCYLHQKALIFRGFPMMLRWLALSIPTFTHIAFPMVFLDISFLISERFQSIDHMLIPRFLDADFFKKQWFFGTRTSPSSLLWGQWGPILFIMRPRGPIGEPLHQFSASWPQN